MNTTLKVISACAVLHNIIMELKYPVPTDIQEEPDQPDVAALPETNRGYAIKTAFINAYFNH